MIKKQQINNCDLNRLKEVALNLSKELRVEDVVCLRGDLGAGKTTFSQFLINSLLEKEQSITSPTFNLLHTYDTRIGRIWHFDLYRLKNIEEVYELGIDDAFSSGISIIEWPEIIEDLLPKNAININLSFSKKDGLRDLIIRKN
jgi:tRNA threonylcarbamoyladenosine biosynthesis protein TsaE